MADDSGRDAAGQRAPHGPVGARAEHEQVDVGASHVEERGCRIGAEQHLLLDLRSVAEVVQRGVECGPCRKFLALERLCALDRDGSRPGKGTNCPGIAAGGSITITARSNAPVRDARS
jgi:hypothetical protein